jgi:hypothetical protein
MLFHQFIVLKNTLKIKNILVFTWLIVQLRCFHIFLNKRVFEPFKHDPRVATSLVVVKSSVLNKYLVYVTCKSWQRKISYLYWRYRIKSLPQEDMTSLYLQVLQKWCFMLFLLRSKTVWTLQIMFLKNLIFLD